MSEQVRFNKGDRVRFLVAHQGNGARVEAGSIGIVTGQVETIVSVRVNGSLWLCWPKEIEKEPKAIDEYPQAEI